METILNNLLSNAIKFTPSGGKLLLKIEDLANRIRITVFDNGRGIHPDDIPLIFERYFQSSQASALAEGGTGIGLALCQEFVILLGGSIQVESKLGKGSTFILELPRKEVLGAAAVQPMYELESESVKISTNKENATTEKQSSTNQATILVVEDNHTLRDYIKTILEPHYKVATAENGLRALDYLQEVQVGNQTCQLVLSDIMMPQMDGYKLLKTLKESDYLRELPIIMLTARADQQDRLKTLRIGADDYLLKPFEEEELLLRIDKLLKNYKVGQKEEDQEYESINKPILTLQTNVISKEDQKWLQSFENYIRLHLADPKLNMAQLSHEFAMSESSLLRQIKRLSGLTPSKYIQEIRLNKSKQLMENKNFKTISDIATQVGFSDAKAFSRRFKTRYGKSPSYYLMP